MPKKIQLIVASTRQSRIADAITPWVQAQVAKNPAIELEVIDLKDINLPFFDGATPPSQAPDSTPAGKAWGEKISSADGYIFLTPEYNRSIPASLKNALDFLVAEWKEKPAGIISYGWVDGGKAATSHLHDVLTWLKINNADTQVALRFSGEMFDETGFVDIDQAFVDHEPTTQTMLAEISA